ERAAIDRLYAREGDVHRLREKPRAKDEVDRYHADGNLAVAVLQRAGLPEAASSITAAEVLHGALEDLDEPLFRFFYFRDPAVTAAIPDPEAATYREPPGSFAERAVAELKSRIADPATVARMPSGGGATEMRPLSVYEYPAAWDERTRRIIRLQEFGARVEADLLASVDAELGHEVEPLEGFPAEAAAMEAFMESRAQRYVVGSRDKAFDELEVHASSDAPPETLVVVGEPGSGKSAMLTWFVRDHQARHPDHLVLPHFVGASAASTQVRQVVRRLWHELVQGAGLSGGELDRIPDDWDELREGFPDVLARAAVARHVVLVIDAVNQLDPAHQAHSMRWLPEELPPGARAILSVLPGPALEALEARRVPPRFVPIARLTRGDATAIMDGYLERYRKTLDADQRASLLAKKDAGNALYLLTALEELRTLGTYEEITDRIRELPEETEPLFVWILGRLERDDGFRDADGELIGPGVVRNYCSYLAVGRSGMSEAELAELVAPSREGADPLGNVAALTRLLRPYLMYSGDLLKFFHGQIEQAVKGVYLDEEAERVAAHGAVAEYFRRKADPGGDLTWTGAADQPRSVSELPHHLTEAQMWEELYAVLTDLGFLEAKCTHVAVQDVGEGEEKRKVYGGVYELQDDYRRALEVYPAE
ncbi:MAG TPA: AAA family ATPase, partial [Longimicrobiaceae bacterium]|nr:AAA family ATPase [Longimicrobiaceae bacterium]